LLSEKGLNVYVYDELFSREEIEEMDLRYLDPEKADLIFDSFKLRNTV
jgi:UDP-N-acetyl-D-mannosaminuronic acid dehydrogenase